MPEATLEAAHARIAQLEAALAAAERQRSQLQAEREILQAVLDNTPDVVVLKDHQGNFLLCNQVVARLYGTTPEQMVGRHDGDFGVPAEQAEFFRQNVLGIMARGQAEIVLEDSTDVATGETRHFKSIKTPFLGPDGQPRILVIAHDITDVRRAQARVAESEQRLGYVLAATGEGVWDWDLRTGRLSHNQTWFTMLGYREEELTGTLEDFQRCLVEEERPGIQAALEACLRGEGPYVNEHRMRRSDGRLIHVLDRGDVVERDPSGRPLRMVGSFAEITSQVEARAALQRSLHEKETLLKEIHHRVKNNLQIISSLLSLQAGGVSEPRAQSLLRDSVIRVRSMALIHQKLYQADNLARVDLADYASDLSRELLGSLSMDADVKVSGSGVRTSIDQAVPCGLVLNELLTNAIKHGRSADGQARVSVEVAPDGEGFRLSVADAGPGLPPGLDLARSSSLGLQLVQSLVRQLHARLEVERTGGTRITLRVDRLG